MKYFIVVILSSFLSQELLSQAISKDGKYAFDLSKGTLYAKSSFDSWEFEMKGVNGQVFFADNNKIVFGKKDSLCILTAGTSNVTQIRHVSNFQKAAADGIDYLVFLSSRPSKKLHIVSLASGIELELLDNVDDFRISPNANAILFRQNERLFLLSLSSVDKPQFISSANIGLASFVFDANSEQIAFSYSEMGGSKQIWYYKVGMDSAKLLLSKVSTTFPSGLKLSDDKTIFGFTPTGNNLCFFLEKDKDTIKPVPAISSVNVFSYIDALPQPTQVTWLSPKFREYRPRYLATVDVRKTTSAIVLLQHTNQFLTGLQDNPGEFVPEITNDYVLLFQTEGDLAADFAGESQSYLLSDYNWSAATKLKVFLVSLVTGEQTLIRSFKLKTSSKPIYKFSLDNKYVVFFDAAKSQYYSYEIASRKIKNISERAATVWINGARTDKPSIYFAAAGSINMVNGANRFIVTDHFGDCWSLDPSGQSNPHMLTSYMGRKDGIVFRPIPARSTSAHSNIDNVLILFKGERSFVESGFYLCESINNPKIKRIVWGNFYGPYLTKADSANVFLIGFETAKSPRSLYICNSNNLVLQRMGNYNSSSEVPIKKDYVSWKTQKGKNVTGLLYKPKNFDPQKKYPVIISYYENLAALLLANRYEIYNSNASSAVNSARPSVQYCLNNDYLVFYVNNVGFQLGSAGETALDDITSAAKYLWSLPFVDKKKIGIEGQSFGGWQTNFLITRTNIFAAAVSSSGMTNIFSWYGEMNADPEGYPHYDGQVRIGVKPWERPDLFLKNSPLFYADKVSTPVLFMANKNDLRVPQTEGVSFFKYLRMMGKPSWMLQYDNGGHYVDKEDAVDLGIRQMQFFDHYLKGAPAPVWMTRGIPASQKGKTLGYEYDTIIKTPGPGLFMENPDAYTPEQKELLIHKTTVNNEGRIVDVIEPPKRKTIKKNK